MYRLLDYGWMLRDRARIDAYTRALASVITPTSVVLDIGTGLGTFGLIAARLGAARVYAIDATNITALAERNARANGFADRVEVLCGRAIDAELPEPVDVIVSDLSGALPLFEEHLPSVIHARDRFLEPGGTLIPQRDRLFCAPLSDAALYADLLAPWRSVPGIDLTAAETMALHAPHALRVDPDRLAAEPRCWGELDYATLRSPDVSASLEWTLATTCDLHGIVLWFESTLQGDITISSGPRFPESVYATMVLPLLQPLSVRAGEVLRLDLDATLVSGHYAVTWQAGTEQQPGTRQSTLLSEPRRGAARADEVAPLPPRATFRPSAGVVCRNVGHEVLLLDPASGLYHVLNETGTRVWERLRDGEAVETIAAAVASEYDVDAQRAAGDVALLVAQLEQARLIERTR
jgi:SAM-dependent methyltransferase